MRSRRACSIGSSAVASALSTGKGRVRSLTHAQESGTDPHCNRSAAMCERAVCMFRRVPFVGFLQRAHAVTFVGTASETTNECKKTHRRRGGGRLHASRSEAITAREHGGGKENVLCSVFPGLHDPDHHPRSALVLACDGCSFLTMPLIGHPPAAAMCGIDEAMHQL